MVTCLPLNVTCAVSVTSMVRMSLPSLITMLQVPATTFSLKFSTIFEPTATAVALSKGELKRSRGTVVSGFLAILLAPMIHQYKNTHTGSMAVYITPLFSKTNHNIGSFEGVACR